MLVSLKLNFKVERRSMKTKHVFYIVVLIFICIAAACGGGSSEGERARNVSGNWSGALTKTSDNCTPQNPATLNFTHTVTQNEEAVTLVTNALFQYLGNIVGGNGFSVDGNRPVTIGNTNCTEDSRIEYDEIADDDDAGASVELNSTFNCSNGTCQTQYTGTASRGVATTVSTPGVFTPGASTPTPGARTPTAIPGATTVPVGGGCAAMNPNPAAGEYHGDGSCGISDSALRVVQQTNGSVVTLEPFGENGLATFAINPANSSAATSISTNLTIKGEAGFTCTLTCSPPGTFTAQCIKEGSTSCTEKF
jgi:hypothetical protein